MVVAVEVPVSSAVGVIVGVSVTVGVVVPVLAGTLVGVVLGVLVGVSVLSGVEVVVGVAVSAAMPLPLRAISMGEEKASAATLMLPPAEPNAVGLKTTPKVHELVPAMSSCPVQVSLTTANGPLGVTPVTLVPVGVVAVTCTV